MYLGIITSIEVNHKNVDVARKGQEVCIKIENVPSETPKLYGRHFDHEDMLTSRVSTCMVSYVTRLHMCYYHRPCQHKCNGYAGLIIAFFVLPYKMYRYSIY